MPLTVNSIESIWLAFTYLDNNASKKRNHVYSYQEYTREAYINWVKQDIQLLEFQETDILDSWDKAQRTIDECIKNNVSILLRSDFGLIRKGLDKAVVPPLLFYRGIISPTRPISIVGSRELTVSGGSEKLSIDLRNSFRSLLETSPEKWSIVSGLALGCDTLAHKIALELETVTIAVLPTSPSPTEIYPKENKALSEEIIEKGGFLISEYAPLTSLQSFHFPKRNKIQAAIGEALVVLDASEGSGTFHTIDAAKKQKKPIYHNKQIQASALLKRSGSTPIDLEDSLSFKKIIDSIDLQNKSRLFPD